MWEEEDEGFGGLVAVGVAIAAVAVAALVMLAGLPFRIVVSAGTFAGLVAFVHWLLVKRLPEKPLGFRAGLGLDTFVAAWLLVSFVALCRHGAWGWLGAWGDRWGLHDDARPDTALAVMGVAFLGWQLLRVLEDAPSRRLSGPWLAVGLKIALLFGFAGFLTAGGDAWLKSLFR